MAERTDLRQECLDHCDDDVEQALRPDLPASALRAVLELHRQADAPYAWMCRSCGDDGQKMDCTYPCDTIRVIARELGVTGE